MAPPSYGGAFIFGLAVHMQMIANPTAEQLDAFFGIEGLFALFGGGRGRTHLISGCLFAVTDGYDDDAIALLNVAEGVIHSYADGIARTLIDTRGRVWPNTIFRDEFQPDPMGPRPTADQGWVLPYRMVMHSLT
jgi:hypothetical protein